MNPVGELLSVDDIELDLDVPGKETLLKRIAATLARRHHLNEAEVLESLTSREELGSTAVGHGVAIPHARMTQCGAAAGVFVRTRVGIPFDASDGKPVSLFLGLIVPQQANERHLKLLATAAAMFSDRSFRDQIRACANSNAMHALLTAWPDSPLSQGRDKPNPT
ncbi:MAG: PTS sugar transporter subunit IIA [Thiobacillaceae bacterium]